MDDFYIFAMAGDFHEFGLVPKMEEDEIERYLKEASAMVNNICLGRLYSSDWKSFPIYTQDAIKEATLVQANFMYENKELFSSTMKKYSIEQRSYEIGAPVNAVEANGTTVCAYAYILLKGCGLLSQNFGWKRGLI